jgi:hypothetical protein
MARIGAQVSLARINAHQYSIIILVNNRFYYHPVEMYYLNIVSNIQVLFNEIQIGNVTFNTSRNNHELVIKYCTEQRSITFSQLNDMWINIQYEERYGKRGYRFNFPKSSPPVIKEFEYLAKNIPQGYLFDIFHVILRLINEINASGKLRELIFTFFDD